MGEGTTYADLITPDGLARVSTWAEAIGPDWGLILPRDADNRLLPPTRLVADAHAAGLRVHAWTVRAENAFLPQDWRSPAEWPDELRAHGDVEALLRALYDLGVDGVFADFPGVAAVARGAQAPSN
jgi:glycerophosphoryl diester phosphodiesterase